MEANASIHARGQQNREFEGMGTTTTALLLRPEGAWVNLILTTKIQPQIALVSGKCRYSKVLTTFSRHLHS